MTPLLVTAEMAGVGVVGDGYFPLDSILAWATWAASGRPEVGEAPAVEALERRGDGPDWYYAASFAAADWRSEGRSFWVKRARLSEMRDRTEATRIDTAAGRLKGYQMPVFYLLASEIRWWCVGDAGRIQELLARVDCLGKKRSQGWGVVRAWKVEPADVDWSEARDGVVTRGLPEARAKELGADGEVGHYGRRPAYWDPRHQELQVLPPMLVNR